MTTKTILHLDDHHLFRQGIRQLISKVIADVTFLSYHSPIVALNDIEERLNEGLPIDLIITDYNHIGITGYEFAGEVRKLEIAFSKSILIMLGSMMNDNFSDGQKDLVTLPLLR